MAIDFFLIGPAKTASTWLHKCLSEHPQIFVPPSKDINYYNEFYWRGPDWYSGHFTGADQNQKIGDIGHDYVLDEDCLRRIHRENPRAKILICLRDPVERTQSGILYLQRNGYGFEDLPTLLKKHSELLEGSLNFKNLERVFKVFNRDLVHIILYREIQSDPVFLLQKIFRFLEVDAQFTPPSTNTTVNKAARARIASLSYLVKRLAIFARSRGLGKLVGHVKMNRFVRTLLYSEKKETVRTISNSDREFLEEVFNDDASSLATTYRIKP